MKNKMTLSLVIPVYNEAQRIDTMFAALRGGVGSAFLKLGEVIFVNDGSTDKTLKVLRSAKSTLARKLGVPVRIVHYTKNRGKGYAVKSGMAASTCDYLLLADVDVSTPFSELLKMDTHLKNGRPVVIGTRKNGHSTVVVPQPMYRQILGKCFTWLTQIILGMKNTDFTCGFKLFPRSIYPLIADRMTVDRWGYDAEIIYLAAKYGGVITEVPVAWYDDNRSKVRLWKDMYQSFVDLIAIRSNDIRGVYADTRKRVTLEKGVSAWQFVTNLLS